MKLNKFIDHTLLKADATAAQIEALCLEALIYDFFSVCVNPCWVKKAAALVKDSSVKVCTVAGFPLGANSSVIKAAEAAQAVLDGAQEIDMVMNSGALKSGDFDFVYNDIFGVIEAVRGVPVKVILETCLLNQEKKEAACRICLEAGAAFVKTSTGFSTGGATVEDVKLLRKLVGERCGVKASGGIRDWESAQAMIAAGATRLGTSSGAAIVQNVIGEDKSGGPSGSKLVY